MIQDINILKSWFETRDKPTQQQFGDLIDSFRHKSSKITATDLDNELLNAINATVSYTIIVPLGVTQWQAPAGTLIEKILIESDEDLIVNVGKTPGANDLIADFEILGTDGFGSYAKDIYCKNQTTIYFSGTTGTSLIKIYIRI